MGLGRRADGDQRSERRLTRRREPLGLYIDIKIKVKENWHFIINPKSLEERKEPHSIKAWG